MSQMQGRVVCINGITQLQPVKLVLEKTYGHFQNWNKLNVSI